MAGVMAIIMFAMMSMQQSQLKSNNFLEFQLNKTQLQNTLIGQVFKDPNNCACLFAGANPFPQNPGGAGATLTGVNPTRVGRYEFVTPGVCGTATMPQPLVDDQGIAGLKTVSIRLRDIKRIAGVYSGQVVIDVSSTKNVLGPSVLPIQIPVNITATPNGAGAMNFQSCSTSTAANLGQDLANLYSGITAKTTYSCWRQDNNAIHTSSVTCDAGRSLLYCDGYSGDQFNNEEAFWIETDHSSNTCRLFMSRPACQNNQTRARVTAYCYPTN